MYDLKDITLDPRLKDVFSLQNIWNESITFGREERKSEPRSHMWATEIGRSYY